MKNLKKIIITGMTCCVFASNLFAGGILTNTNQSVHFLRNPARDASTEIDAVYTNPAGLSLLPEDGFHFSLNNQSAFQTRTITSTFAPFAMNGGNDTKVFEGKAEALFIPSLQAAYKKGNWVFSGSLAVVGGGGSLVFANGLPSFESQVAMLPLMLSAQGIPTSLYSLESRLEGTSITYGTQLGATYKINEMFSGFVGVRASFVGNSYEGYIRNIQANIGGGDMTNVNEYFTNAATGLSALADGLQGIPAGAPLNVLPPPAFAMYKSVLGDAANVLTVGQAQGILSQKATEANGVAAQTADKAIDVAQSGWGIAPILGFNFNYDKLNVGVKYEFMTKMNVENKTEINTSGVPSFDDKVKTPYDIPALLTIGAKYDILPCVTVSAGYHHFFDSNAKMADVKDPETGNLVGKQNFINGGTNEFLLGAEYRINKMFLVSAGGQITRYGVTDNYQSDLNFSLNSYSIGFGGAVNVTESIRINAAYFFSNYSDWTKTPGGGTATDVFARTNKAFGIGVDFRF